MRSAVSRPTWYAGGDTALGELWTMLHLPYTLMVFGFVIVGAALAPTISWPLLAGTLAAYALGLGIGAHFLDQIPGMGSTYVRHWPPWSLWTFGFAGVLLGAALGAVAAFRFVGPPLLVLVGIQGMCAVGYPLAMWFRGAFHRDSVFAISWGSLPFLTSFYAQTRTLTLVVVPLAVIFAAVALLEIRLSRRSRELRSALRDPSASVANPSRASLPVLRRFDRSLQLLSALTGVVAVVLLVGRAIGGPL